MINLPKTIKMIITDFDGIVTDNCVYISDDFSMTRKLNFKDVMAFSILKKNGYKIGIIFTRNSYQNIRNKIEVLKSIVAKYELSKDEFVYIGDDINDIECLEYAKYKITASHAVDKVKALDGIQVFQNKSGDGAFREVADCLIG